MKVLIIPDIHGQFPEAEAIIARENPDLVIFLGDYFDFFGDQVFDAVQIAEWLKISLGKKNRIHLIGNHDLSYMTDNPYIRCSGYTGAKHKAIESVNLDWGKLKLYHWQDDWLCTHAGLSKSFIPKGYGKNNINDLLELADLDIVNLHNTKKEHKFLEAGMSRGGSGDVGGIVWCDYSEFKSIPGINQIFGHTRDGRVRQNRDVRKDTWNICLDTALHDYAILENGEMRLVNLD